MAAEPSGHLALVGALSDDLRALGLRPVLVGGMALAVLGSRRITRDFDFVVTQPGERLTHALQMLYGRGFQLVSRLHANGDVAATIDNVRVAAARLRIDAPASAYFYNSDLELRVDLLFDFPIEAAELSERATRMKIQSHLFEIASEADLLTLKKIAAAARSVAGDAQDIAFLEARLKDRP
jgi:hypothetical protein